jgi:hypothetical protein
MLLSMRRWRPYASLVIALFVALVACVPATTDPSPRGGLGLETVPSPAARGEPLVTSDGWTVTIESLVLQIYVVAVPDDGVPGGFGGTYIFSGRAPEEFIIRAVPEGRAKTTLTLATRYLTSGYEPIYNGPNATTRVSYDIDARFNKPADDASPVVTHDADSGDLTLATTDGPAVLLVARAEKAGRVVHIDTAFAGSPTGTDLAVDVRANDLSRANVTIAAERLFMKNGVLLFDDIAQADTDNDGVITLAEMRRLNVPLCPRCSPAEKLQKEEEAKSKTVLALLGDRVSDLLVPGP